MLQHHSAGVLDRILVQQRQEELVLRHILRDRINDGTTSDSRLLPPAAAAAPVVPSYNQPSMMIPGQQPDTSLGFLVAGARFGQHHDAADFGRLTTTTPDNIMNAVSMEMPAVVALASQIMKSNPGIEPWRALKLAKICLPGHEI